MNPRPLRILFVHHRRELGGAPTSLAYLIGALDRERYEPHVYCPPGAAAELFAVAGATVHTGQVAVFTHIWASVYRGRRWLLFVRELLRLPGHLVGLHALLRRERFDVVHLNESPLVPAALLARRAGVPVVWHLRSAFPFDGQDLRSRLLRRAIRRLAAAAVAINEDVAASFDVGATVVPNPVDLERFAPGDPAAAKATLGLPPDRPVVAFFGFLYPSKGFREFIRAARFVLDAGVEASFLVVGGAVRGDEFFRRPIGRLLERLDLARNYEREARELVRELDLERCVRFVAFTRDAAGLYRAADVVVAPSTGPELGRPVLEGAASGVPVVASGSVTGGGVILDGETGVLVRGATPERIADAVTELLGAPELRQRLGAAARAHAEREFAVERVAEHLDGIYRLIARADGPVPILFVHHRPQLGGAPSSLALLIRHLDRERFEPHVYVPPGQAAQLFEAAGAVTHTGPVAIFKHGWGAPYAGLRWLVLAREVQALVPHVRRLTRLLATHRFPIVHLNDSPLLAAGLVAHARGAKVVWHLRSALFRDGLDARGRAISRLIDATGDAAIAIDRDVARTFRTRIPVRIVPNSVVLPAGSELGRDEARRQLHIPDGVVAIGFTGFVRRPKGWPELVEAAERLIGQGLPVHFVIMGGGVRAPAFFRTPRGRLLSTAGVLRDEETELKQLVAEKGLQAHFQFLSFTTHTGDIYRALDLVTFPSQGVGLGRPVVEAQAYGVPVVASGSADGAGLLLPDETGVLLRSASAEELADALARLVADDDLRRRLGERAAEHARATFDPERNARLVEELYDELLRADD